MNFHVELIYRVLQKNINTFLYKFSKSVNIFLKHSIHIYLDRLIIVTTWINWRQSIVKILQFL